MYALKCQGKRYFLVYILWKFRVVRVYSMFFRNFRTRVIWNFKTSERVLLCVPWKFREEVGSSICSLELVCDPYSFRAGGCKV